MEEIKQVNMSAKTGKIVNDAIFGFITLKPHIIAIIDTPEFQRLRCIWQLGVTPFVYPTADHCRFEHSIGTYHLASKLVNKIKIQLHDKEGRDIITKEDVKCVEIAALCHDIGHGPFSHEWDKYIIPEISKSHKTHEQLSIEIFDILMTKLKDEGSLKNIIGTKYVDYIKCMMIGNIKNIIFDSEEQRNKLKMLCSIVSNEKSGMDVDKWDYLARDASYLGHSTSNYRVDIKRMIHFARAIKDDDGKWKIAFRKSEGLNMLRVFQLRHYMHQTAYRHRTVVNIELMMLDGFKEYFGEDEKLKSQIDTAEWISENTDSIFWSNIKNNSIFKRIVERKHYKLIFEIAIFEMKKDPIINDATKEDDKKKEEARKNNILDSFKNEINVRFAFCKFTLSSTDGNPMLFIPFYTDNKCDATSNDINKYNFFKYNENDIPSYLQYNVNEFRVMAFVTNDIESEEEKTLKDNFKEYFKKENNKISNGNPRWIFENIESQEPTFFTKVIKHD